MEKFVNRTMSTLETEGRIELERTDTTDTKETTTESEAKNTESAAEEETKPEEEET